MKRTVASLYEAKTHFSELLKRVAMIVGYEPVTATRTPGLLAGRIAIKAEFDELPAGFEQAFGAR